jgi:hypothetical protein
MNRVIEAIFLVVILLVSAPVAAQPTEQLAPPSRSESQEGMKQMRGMGLMQNMDTMATTVTRMAELCEQMMKKEMAAMPYKLAAGIGFGVLVTIVLLLLAVLQVQWIIYWSRLLKQQKRGS